MWTGVCVGYVALIFGTLTLARSLSRWGNRTLGFDNLLWGVNGLYGILLLAVLAEFRRRRMPWAGLVGVLGIAAVAGMALTTIRLPEERIHFIEYMVLVVVAWKMFRAWDLPWSLLGAIVISIGVGVVDESIQGFLPQRVFDWRDIGFNAFGALLGAGLLAIRLRFIRPPLRGGGHQ